MYKTLDFSHITIFQGFPHVNLKAKRDGWEAAEKG